MLVCDFEQKPFGTVFCADGDGLWTVLIVQEGEEHRDIETDVDGRSESPYGFGWEKVGNASREGAYFFNQTGLIGSVLVDKNIDPADVLLLRNEKFKAMVLAMAEMRMQAEDPTLFDYLSGGEVSSKEGQASTSSDQAKCRP